MPHFLTLCAGFTLLCCIAFSCLTARAEGPEAHSEDQQNTQSSSAQELPRWEFGLGLGAVYGPDYRGSDEYRHFASPIPYFIYRGKIIQSDRDGVRGQFLQTDRYQFTLSASAAITPDADQNQRRQGMPELGSTLEIGPSLNLLLSGTDFTQGWHLQLPWRAVFALGGDNSGYLGSLFNPQLVYRHTLGQWKFNYRAGVIFGSNNYHSYYYQVNPDQASASRPAFAARGGYSGWSNNLAFNRQLNLYGFNTRLAFFIRYDNIANTAIARSPLVLSEQSYRAGLAFIWVMQ